LPIVVNLHPTRPRPGWAATDSAVPAERTGSRTWPGSLVERSWPPVAQILSDGC